MVALQKTFAATMILCSAILAMAVLGDFAFPGILGILGLLGLRRQIIWTIRPERRIIKSLLFLLLLVLFSIHYRFGSLTGDSFFAPTAQMAWQTISRYFLAAMILVLFLGSPHVLPPSLALFFIGFCISTGQVLLIEEDVMIYRILELGAVILTILFTVTSQPHDTHRGEWSPYGSRRGIIFFAILLLLTINVGWIMGSVLYNYQGKLTRLSELLWGERTISSTSTQETATVGFSTSGRLSNVLAIIDDLDQEPILTIQGEENPEYLRARAFDLYRYRSAEWVSYGPRDAIWPLSTRLPENVPLPQRQPRQVFRLTQREAAQWRYLQIEQRLVQRGLLFTPLACGYIETLAQRLERDDNDILYGPRLRHEDKMDYALAYTRARFWKPPNTSLNSKMLKIPTSLDPRIRTLAKRIFSGCTTPEEKINAVIAYFRKNYTYALGMDAPPDEDPLTYFLLEAETGYCEYFATGAAILLRLADVPTRYVTGFMITERDETTGAWIARNAHAHAWVEAWNEQESQWVLVEATVQEDLTDLLEDDNSDAQTPFQEFLRQWRQVFYSYGLIGAVLWLFHALGWVPWLILVTTLVLGIRALIRYRSNNFINNQDASRNNLIHRLHHSLKQMDRRVRRLGLRRSAHETLHSFADRICQHPHKPEQNLDSIAQWYRQYAFLRYQRQITPEDVQNLVQTGQQTPQ